MGRCLLSGARRFLCLFSSQSTSTFYRTSRSVPGCRAAYSFSVRTQNFATMAAADTLPASVESLSLQSTSQKSPFPGCFPSLNPVDVYREHIATELSKATGIDAEKIYSRLAWTNTLDKGDLTLPVCESYSPASRAPGLYRRQATFEWSTHLPLVIVGPRTWHQEKSPRARAGIGSQVPRIQPRQTSHCSRSSFAILLQASTPCSNRSWSYLEGESCIRFQWQLGSQGPQ